MEYKVGRFKDHLMEYFTELKALDLDLACSTDLERSTGSAHNCTILGNHSLASLDMGILCPISSHQFNNSMQSTPCHHCSSPILTLKENRSITVKILYLPPPSPCCARIQTQLCRTSMKAHISLRMIVDRRTAEPHITIDSNFILLES
jgi:hypothetical protein